MRSGVIISAVGHVAAAALAVLFTGVNPFNSVATEAIAVEIIPPSEAPPDQLAETSPAKESFPIFDPQFDLVSAAQPATQSAPPPAQPAAKPVQTSRPHPAAPQQSASQANAPRATSQRPAKLSQAAPPAPVPPQYMPPAAQESNGTPDRAAGRRTANADPVTPKETNVADLFSMPLALPDGRLGGGFDAPAMEPAKIERSSADAFRASVKTCAMLPAGVASNDQISLVLRVRLKPDGTLAGQPTLIAGSASAKGPALLQSLLGGLTKCQPYNMLPASNYQEWKSLDIRFTPDDLGQG